MSEFNTREAWLAYRNRRATPFRVVFVSTRDEWVQVALEDGTTEERLKKVRVTYNAGKRIEKNNKYDAKISARNARRAAKLAARKGPMEAVLQ